MENLAGLDHLLKITIRFWPVWVAMAIVMIPSFSTRRNTGLYGQIFESRIGVIGFSLVSFWVFTAIFADVIMTHDPYATWGGLKNALPGSALRAPAEGIYPHALLGGDNLARDVFSRVVEGSRIVLTISPIATLFAFMVGITLGLLPDISGAVWIPRSPLYQT